MNEETLNSTNGFSQGLCSFRLYARIKNTLDCDLNKDAMRLIAEPKRKMGNSIKFTDLSAMPFKEIKRRNSILSSKSILKGEVVGKIVVDKNLGNQYVFDQLALQKFNIPLSALPRNSIIENRKRSY